MIKLAILCLILACAADAYTTVALIRRGGRERWMAWLVGEKPAPAVCWMVFCAVPCAITWAILQELPELAPLVLLLAALRAVVAVRNHRLVR